MKFWIALQDTNYYLAPTKMKHDALGDWYHHLMFCLCKKDWDKCGGPKVKVGEQKRYDITIKAKEIK